MLSGVTCNAMRSPSSDGPLRGGIGVSWTVHAAAISPAAKRQIRVDMLIFLLRCPGRLLRIAEVGEIHADGADDDDFVACQIAAEERHFGNRTDYIRGAAAPHVA